jgi:hypothetical protein
LSTVNLTTLVTDAQKDPHTSHPLLSGEHFSLAGIELPAYAIVLSVYYRGHSGMGSIEGDLDGHQTDLAMPSVGHTRARSGTQKESEVIFFT